LVSWRQRRAPDRSDRMKREHRCAV
jgi:hypothetical protein